MTTLQHRQRTLAELRTEYVDKRAIFIPGEEMVVILSSLGADPDELAALVRTSDDLPDDPTLPFRKSRNGRFAYDTETGRIRRLEFQPFVLSAAEDFVRHDSGQVRRFAETQGDVQDNSVFRALLAFKYLMVQDVEVDQRPYLDYASPIWITTLFHLRTITTSDLLGEPALEGVHSDGVDHTMTTLLDATNMAGDSATTFVHDMRQANAVRWDEAAPELVRGRWQHRDALDTLLVVDHELKHSLSPVNAVEPTVDATRDMLIFFTRKPAVEGHVSFVYDSTRPHLSLPLAFDVPSTEPHPEA